MLDTGDLAILVDCGLVQGDKFAMEKNAEVFVYDPKAVDILLVTHAHADHIGRIPKLVRDGFSGKIYSTHPTKELAGVMMRDALKVMQYEANKFGQEVLYEEKDIDTCLNLWQTVGYEEKFTLGTDIKAWYTDAGHILGSGMIHLVRGDKKNCLYG